MPAQTQNFERHLMNIARGYASMVTRLAKGYAPNSHLRESIHSEVDQKGQADFIIRVRARGPDARAREYGSGIHARRMRISKHQMGPKGKILIAPKNKAYLAFPWDKSHPFPIYNGKAVINRYWQPRGSRNKTVQHPGVEAANSGRGYLGPAMNDTRKAMREKMKKEGALAIRLDLRDAFKTKGLDK